MTALVDDRPPTEQLCFHHSVPRSVVHRAAISEVFLTDSVTEGDRVLVAAQLPRNHSYFSDHRGTSTSYDSLLLVEVFRQVAIYYAHTYCGVSHEEKFVFGAAHFAMEDRESLRIGDRPGHCVVTATVGDRKLRDGELTGLTLEMTAWVDGVRAATESMAYQWMPGAAWQKIRSRGRRSLGLPDAWQVPSPTDLARLRPEAVGRHNPRNSILASPRLGGQGFSATTVVDTDHPSLFDHELDHVAGMLQFEACRQIAMAAVAAELGLDTSRLLMIDFDVAFTRFGEFELATDATAADISAVDDRTVTAQVTLGQDDAVICTGTVTLHRCDLDLRTMVS